MNDWIQVAIAIGAGLLIGLVASRIVHAMIGSPSRPEPLQKAAAPLASLAFSVGVIGGLVVALGIVQPDALDQLVEDTVGFIPKLLSAAIIVIAANVVSAFATTALSGVVGRLPIQTQRLAHTVVKATIITLAVLLAVGQLGINTDVLNLGVAAVFFGIAASLTLLVGMGGNGVAREVASTRALRRLVNTGDTLDVGGFRGKVSAIHPTAVEITDAAGRTKLVPSSQLVSETITIERATPDPTAAETDRTGSA